MSHLIFWTIVLLTYYAWIPFIFYSYSYSNSIVYIVLTVCLMPDCVNVPLCGAENVSLMVSVELLGFTSSGGLLSIMLYGGGGVSAGKACHMWQEENKQRKVNNVQFFEFEYEVMVKLHPAGVPLKSISLLVVIPTCDVIRTAGLCRAVGGVGVTLWGGRLGERGGRGGWEGGAGQRREGVWVGGVLGHQGLVVQGGVPELCQ